MRNTCFVTHKPNVKVFGLLRSKLRPQLKLASVPKTVPMACTPRTMGNVCRHTDAAVRTTNTVVQSVLGMVKKAEYCTACTSLSSERSCEMPLPNNKGKAAT